MIEGEFCRLLMTFVNSLDPDQDRDNVDPDLDTDHLYFDNGPEIVFLEKLILKKSADDNRSMNKYPARVLTYMS